MKKKLGIFALCMSLVLSACSVSELGLQRQDPVIEEDEEEEEEISIELSEKKVEIDAGEEAEIEIENYDDLSKVKVEVEDEDIAEVDIDDEIITITGISGGKTKVIVSAKGCDDVKITVKVNEPEPEPVAESLLASRYESVLYMDDTFWQNVYESGIYSEEELEDAQAMIEIYKTLNLGITFYMDFTIDGNTEGDASFYMDADKFGQDIVDTLNDEKVFYNFVTAIAEMDSAGAVDEDFIEFMMEEKDYFITMIQESLSQEFDISDVTYDVKWRLEDTTLFLTFEGVEYRTELNPDGSFTLSVDGNSSSPEDFFAYDVNMDFYPVEE